MTLLVGSLTLMAGVITSVVLYQSYKQVEHISVNHTLNVARIAQRSISRNMELLSLALEQRVQVVELERLVGAEL